MSEDEIIYPSKVDWWVGALLAGAPAIHLPLGIWVMGKTNPIFGFALIFWGLIIAMIFAALNFPCRYHLSATSLTIRSGMVTDTFSLSRIKKITQVQSLKPAPALSGERVELTLTDGTTRLISPANRSEFIEQIESRMTK